MGTTGYERARDVDLPGDVPWVILEVGAERDSPAGGSTTFLAGVGPPLHVIDVDPAQVTWAARLPNVTAHLGLAEDVLPAVLRPPGSSGLVVGFAWLDGHDWPYEHVPDATWDAQRAEYAARGQPYSRAASAHSHLVVARLLAPHVPPGGWVACDDTWRLPSVLDPTPGPAPGEPPTYNGKGGAAVPYLRAHGFTVTEWGDVHHGLVVLRRDRPET